MRFHYSYCLSLRQLRRAKGASELSWVLDGGTLCVARLGLVTLLLHAVVIARQVLGQRIHGRIFEQLKQRQLSFEGFLQLAMDLYDQQRMPTEVEEVVVDADLLHFQNFLPNPGDDAL